MVCSIKILPRLRCDFSGFGLDWGLLAALALALPIILPMLHDGIVITAHGHIHLHRALSASVSLDNGMLFPRWSPYAYLGYGYPALNYYAPGLYIVTGLIERFTPLDIIGAYKLISIGIVFAYSGGAYLLGQRLVVGDGDSVSSAGLLAAAVYTYSPFLLRDLYMVGTVAQYVAFGLAPWVLWAFLRMIDQPKLGKIVLAGMLLALMTITHQIAIYLFAPLLVVFVLVLGLNHPANRQSAVAILLALALSAVYWLPLIFELSYVQTGLTVDPAYRIENNFLTLSHLFAGTTLIDQTLLNIWADAGPLGLRIGHAQFGVMVLSLLAWVRPVGWRLRWLVTCCVGMALICVFMMTPPSLPLWSLLPGASLMQFPWRLIALVNVLTLVCAVAVVMLFPAIWRKWVGLIGVGIAFAMILPLTYAQLGFDRFERGRELIPADTLAYEVTSGQTGLGSYSEFITTWVLTPPMTPPTEDIAAAYQGRTWYIGLQENLLPDDITINEIISEYGVMRYRFEAPASTTITLDQFYFPGFEVNVNNVAVESRPTNQTGLLQFDIPSGTSDVTIRYVGTPLQTAASLISVMTLVVMGMLVAVPTINNVSMNFPLLFAPPHLIGRDGRWGSGITRHSPLSLMLIAAVWAFLALDQTLIRPHTGLFRLQSDPQNPPMSQPVHSVFGDQLELLGYDFPQAAAARGDMIPLRLYWRALNPTEANLRAVVRLTSRGGVEEWSKVIAPHIADLPTSEWLTNRYVIDDYLLTISDQASPFSGQLTVSVFPEYTDLAYLPTQNGQTEVTIAPFRVTGDLQRVAEVDLTPINADFANGLRLVGMAAASGDEAQTCLILRWQVERDQTSVYSTLLHFMDANGEFLQAADAAPFGDLYPTTHWQGGQTLDAQYCFNAPHATANLLIGLYNAQTIERVPIIRAESWQVRDDTLMLPFTPQSNLLLRGWRLLRCCLPF